MRTNIHPAPGQDGGTAPARRDAAGDDLPSPARAWAGCVVLTFGCILAFMDRGILSLFLQVIQRDLHLTDTEISLLIGFAFGLFNALFGLPIARLVDSRSRKAVAAAGVLLWSVASGACGLASSFWQLFAARTVVGAGEGTVMPSAVSLLADLFPSGRRGAPMGLFYSGVYLGNGGVLLLGGLIWRTIGDRMVALPLIGALHSWQLILIGFAGLGLLIAPLTMLIAEPRRRDGTAEAGAALSLGEVGRFYRRHRRTLFGHNAAFCCQNFAVHAGFGWLPAILMRSEGWSLAQVGAVYGTMVVVLAPLGSLSAGVAADIVTRRGHADGKLLVAMSGMASCALASIVIGSIHHSPLVVVALAAFTYFQAFSMPLGPGALQDIVPNALRGQATAIYVFWINTLAVLVGTTGVAALTQFVFRDPAKTNVAFAIVSVAGSAAALSFLAWSRASFRRLVSAPA